ncbi:MAG: beta-lactamase family protein [Tidjanibacter sp.]|nr:beta-lactamase family protein [Tidjanibacter sp.]
MKRFLQIAVLCIAVLAVCRGCEKENKTQTLTVAEAEDGRINGFSVDRLSRLDALAEEFVGNDKAPQMVMLVSRHGEIVYDKAFGWKDKEQGEKVESSDIFRIASMSKGIVTVGLMMLYEEGKFVLDDPLYYYIPEFRNMTVLESVDYAKGTYTTRPARRPITIRQLLCHTSGISYGNIAYDEIFIPRTSTLEDITIEETVKRLATRPLNHEPGEKFTYGMGIDVAGYLIEVLSGQPLDEYLTERVLKPLGMEDTYFYLPEEKADRLVTLYSKRGTGAMTPSANEVEQTFPVAGPRTWLSGGAGLCSTVYDYARFVQMLLNGGEFNGNRILGRKTVEMMTTVNQLAENTTPSLSYQWGLGFEIMSANSVAHKMGSVGTYGWSGMYGTFYMVDPVEDMFYILFANGNPWPEKELIRDYFQTAVYQALVD